MAEVSREKFVQQVIEIVRGRLPLVKIARSEQPFSLRINGNVAGLENLYRMAMLDPEQMEHQVERWAVELLRAFEGTPDRDASFEELRERVMPLVISEKLAGTTIDQLVTDPFIGDLRIAYAIDSDRTIAYILERDVSRWGVELDELHETAIDNLVERSQALQAHATQDEDGDMSLIVFHTRDGFDGSRILLPTLHDRLCDHLGSPFAAAVPNRDVLLCFRNDEETVERLANEIRGEFEQMPHQVTDRLLLVTPDGIALRHED